MERRIAFEMDPDGFCEQWADQEKTLSSQIYNARRLLNKVGYTRRDLMSIAGLTSSMNVDGHRADLVILRGAQALAALDSRERIIDQDIVLAAELALPHRIKGRPFQDTAVNAYELEEQLQDVQQEMGTADASETAEESAETVSEKKKP
jgi:Mg-chelatase subunit ChlI